MREILFRAKSAFGNDWVYGYLTSGNDCSGRRWFISSPAKNPDDRNHFNRIDKETVGQFTGLTDKNGKKIFDGDIIKTPPYFEGDKERFWEVSYVGYAWAPFCWNDSEWGTFSWDDTDTEVVGNIYDNPELLKRVEK